jgi:hypothetical protein
MRYYLKEKCVSELDALIYLRGPQEIIPRFYIEDDGSGTLSVQFEPEFLDFLIAYPDVFKLIIDESFIRTSLEGTKMFYIYDSICCRLQNLIDKKIIFKNFHGWQTNFVE